MTIIKNENSVLFLFEGETEKEFYKAIFNKKLPDRAIRINYGNLKGVYDINNKVESKIKAYLDVKSKEEFNSIHVFIAYDREGDRNTETLLNLKDLKRQFITNSSRVKSINEIVATQDLESWLFNDLENIYKFLRVPKAQRNLKAYPNCEKVNNRTLSNLFHKYGRHYQKGKRVNNFILSLDLSKIYEAVPDLKAGIEAIKSLC